MSEQGAVKRNEREPMCDHICLRDDGHVERGEPHFYGYELPSPRTRHQAEIERLRDEVRMFQGWVERQNEHLMGDDLTCEELCQVVCAGPCEGREIGQKNSTPTEQP